MVQTTKCYGWVDRTPSLTLKTIRASPCFRGLTWVGVYINIGGQLDCEVHWAVSFDSARLLTGHTPQWPPENISLLQYAHISRTRADSWSLFVAEVSPSHFCCVRPLFLLCMNTVLWLNVYENLLGFCSINWTFWWCVWSLQTQENSHKEEQMRKAVEYS